MIRLILAATPLLLAVPAAAQSQQEQLEARYDRALAAGYKALFLCSAVANAEQAGSSRSVESVEDLELSGIQAPLDAIVGELKPRFAWTVHARQPASAAYPDGEISSRTLAQVTVPWADGMQPRVAVYTAGKGCALQPIGRPAAPPGADAILTDGIAEGYDPNALRLIRVGSTLIPKGRLSEVVSAGLEGGYGAGARTTAVVVANGDHAISWLYGDGIGVATPQRTWSVAKSLAATLVGAAVHRGEADIAKRGNFPELPADHPLQSITIDDFLRMASGRYSDTPGNRTDPLYFGGSSVDEVVMQWPLVHEPGSVFRYANNDTLMAVESISGTFAAHPPADLFALMGMVDTVAETDWRGDYILSSQVWTTANDLVYFGQLYLNDGKLPDGTRILPEGWVKYVSSPSGPQPEGEFGYGAGFWLLNKSKGVPPDTFAAFGNRGQYVVIVPSRDVVIVRRGEDPAGSRFDIAAFTRDVLTALED